jgi:mannose-6-phosphate isomerase
MGTYPTLPSYVLSTGDDLQDVLEKHKDELLGERVLSKFGQATLPYLPKILSIAKALPLQLHPDKALAEKLHSSNPSQFTDANHKPEIAVALSDFEAFCGFKPLEEIEELFKIDALSVFLGKRDGQPFDNQTLKEVVRSIISSSEELISRTEDKLAKLQREEFGSSGHVASLLPRLQKQYGKMDPGSLVALFTMNYIQLKPGECLYIPADGIHAYLSGDIFECMARSNNVLNTGFCPVADRSSVDLFTSALSFSPHSKEEALLSAGLWDGSKNKKTRIYAPPLSEFKVLAVQLSAGENEEWRSLDGPGILVIMSGEGEMEVKGKVFDLEEGFVFFVGHGCEVRFFARRAFNAIMAFSE